MIAALTLAAIASCAPTPVQYNGQYQYGPTGYQHYQPPQSLIVDPNGGEKYYGKLNDQVTQGAARSAGSDGQPRKPGR